MRIKAKDEAIVQSKRLLSKVRASRAQDNDRGYERLNKKGNRRRNLLEKLRREREAQK